jgi:hypothetical protein
MRVSAQGIADANAPCLLGMMPVSLIIRITMFCKIEDQKKYV